MAPRPTRPGAGPGTCGTGTEAAADSETELGPGRGSISKFKTESGPGGAAAANLTAFGLLHWVADRDVMDELRTS